MSKTKIDLFFSYQGLEAHLEIVPDEGEDLVHVLESEVRRLIASGAQPRPLPGRGGYGGNAKTKNIVPNESCPNCGGAVEERNGTNKQSGKPWRLRLCSAKGEDCYKKFMPNTPTPVPAQAGNPSSQTVTAKPNVAPVQPAKPLEPVRFPARPNTNTGEKAGLVTPQPKVTAVQLQKIRRLATEKKISTASLEARCKEVYGVETSGLTQSQADDLIKKLEAKAVKVS